MTENNCGLGIVFPINDELKDEIENALDFLEHHLTTLHLHHYDEEVEDWVLEPYLNNLGSAIPFLEHRESHIACDIEIDSKQYPATLRISNEHDAFLVQLNMDLSEARVDLDTIKQVSDYFEALIERLDDVTQHNYIYLDTDADYIYTPQRILEIDYTPFSILKIKEHDMRIAGWYWDRFTLRES